jgi:hypothetical protein
MALPLLYVFWGWGLFRFGLGLTRLSPVARCFICSFSSHVVAVPNCFRSCTAGGLKHLLIYIGECSSVGTWSFSQAMRQSSDLYHLHFLVCCNALCPSHPARIVHPYSGLVDVRSRRRYRGKIQLDLHFQSSAHGALPIKVLSRS